MVEVTFDGEIEAPSSVYPSLPDILSLIYFFRSFLASRWRDWITSFADEKGP